MSCGCGKLPKGSFSSQKNSWSCKSDLNMANWDPYPELQNPKNCYGTNVENYCNCSMRDCGLYKIEPNKIDSNYVPLQKSVVVGGTNVVKEGYDLPCCRPTPYNNLNNTWSVQKPYNL